MASDAAVEAPVAAQAELEQPNGLGEGAQAAGAPASEGSKDGSKEEDEELWRRR